MSELESSRGVYERKDDVQIVDVREPYEWEAGRIEGAVHVPLNDLMAGKGIENLDQNKPVAVICRSGNRSEDRRHRQVPQQRPGLYRAEPVLRPQGRSEEVHRSDG